MKTMIRSIVILCGLLVAGTGFDGFSNTSILVKNAEAVVGRPLTPASVAGVSRRTTRRVIQAVSRVRGCPAGRIYHSRCRRYNSLQERHYVLSG